MALDGDIHSFLLFLSLARFSPLIYQLVQRLAGSQGPDTSDLTQCSSFFLFHKQFKAKTFSMQRQGSWHPSMPLKESQYLKRGRTFKSYAVQHPQGLWRILENLLQQGVPRLFRASLSIIRKLWLSNSWLFITSKFIHLAPSQPRTV